MPARGVESSEAKGKKELHVEELKQGQRTEPRKKEVVGMEEWKEWNWKASPGHIRSCRTLVWERRMLRFYPVKS